MQKAFRLLLPWFDRQTAIALVVGGRPADAHAVAEAAEMWNRSTEALRGRTIESFDTATLPLPPSCAGLARAFAAATAFTTIPEFAGAEIQLVALASLLSFQARIAIDDRGASFVAGYDGTMESLFGICLPALARMDPVQVITDGPTARIASDNPNLRFGGFALSGSTLTATFGFRAPWVQVVEYRGRLFVRNGYHRLRALLEAGATHAVAIVSRVQTLAELGAAEPGYIREDLLLGHAPPLLRDFEDPRFYAVVHAAAPRRVISLSATEHTES